MDLLRTQRNALFDAISESPFHPTQFDISVEGAGNPAIAFRGEGLYSFMISFNQYTDSEYILTMSPSYSRRHEQTLSKNWSDVLIVFKLWLGALKREVSVEDKWLTLQNAVNDVSIIAGDTTNNKFSAQEFLQLSAKIKELQTNISNSIALPQDQISVVNQKLDSILEHAISLGKFDWQNLFIGTIVAIIIQLSVTKENANLLWELIKKIFNDTLMLA